MRTANARPLLGIGLLLATVGCTAPRPRYLPDQLPAPPESGSAVSMVGQYYPGTVVPAPPSPSTRSDRLLCNPIPQSTLPAQQPYTLPRELTKVSHPDYVIEPPDILVINAQKVVALPPYKLEPLDAVLIKAKAPLPEHPLEGEYMIEPNGRVNLGPKYGTVPIAGLTTDEARAAVEAQLKDLLGDPTVYLAPTRTRPPQQIVGEHLVRPDGKVGLGSYGFVHVAGMTVVQAKQAIEARLSQFLQSPEVSVDVAAYNSKVIYVISDGGG
ncbi:MAG TPA: polysaccharide biosynthesis/export family protein, partial [Gemmataceae bacterium]|nr:polysaccharide biosynthesis/export family protein [Gemmataceae bacterium]